MVTLDELAIRHGTDKGSRPFRHLSAKGYTEHYERLFAARRLEPIRLLEIGVAGGGSLRMWADYFPRARIVGLDVDPRCVRHEAVRISVVNGPQADHGPLGRATDALGGPPDVVVDDGSHRFEDQVASFSYLWPRLASGGVYAIEDAFARTREHFASMGAEIHRRLVVMRR